MDRKDRTKKAETSPDRDDLVLKLLGVPHKWMNAIYQHAPLKRTELSRFCDVFSPELAIQNEVKNQIYKPDVNACNIIQRSNRDAYIRNKLHEEKPVSGNLSVGAIKSIITSSRQANYKYTYLSTSWLTETKETHEFGAFFGYGPEETDHYFCDSSIRTSQVITNLIDNIQKNDAFTLIFLLPLNQKYQGSQPDKVDQHHWHILERELIDGDSISRRDSIATVAAIQLMTLGARIVQHKDRSPWINSNVSTNVTRDVVLRTVLNKHLNALVYKDDKSVFDIRTLDSNELINIQPDYTFENFSEYTSMDIPQLIKRAEVISTCDESSKRNDWYSLEDPMKDAKMDDFLAFYHRLYQLLTNSSGILCKIDIKLNTETGKASNQRIMCPTYWKEYLGNKSGTNKQGSKDRDDLFQRSNPDGTSRPHQFFPPPEFRQKE